MPASESKNVLLSDPMDKRVYFLRIRFHALRCFFRSQTVKQEKGSRKTQQQDFGKSLRRLIFHRYLKKGGGRRVRDFSSLYSGEIQAVLKMADKLKYAVQTSTSERHIPCYKLRKSAGHARTRIPCRIPFQSRLGL